MNTVTGYQWGDSGSYIGPYAIPVIDPENVYLPPRTTLKLPPADLPAGQEAAFDVSLDQWFVRPKDMSWVPAPVATPTPEPEPS